MRTLVVWCPDWPVVAAGCPREVPAAVVAANRVVAATAAARADGVRAGLRRREAQGRCPGVILLAADPARDAREFEPVVAALEAFTAGVDIVRAGLAGFATRGPSGYFGGDEELARRVLDAVSAVLEATTPGVGASCRVGVADGRFAAGLAARFPPAGGGSSPADGEARWRVVAPGRSREHLAPLPVATLGDGDLAELFGRLGLATLGDLAALPAATVLARFGVAGEVAHRLARGLDDRPLAVRVPPADLTVTVELDPPAERVDVAAFAARSLAVELHERLDARGLTCARVAVEAETDHGEHLSRWWRHEGELGPGGIAERVRWQLDGWLGRGGTTGGLTLLRLVPDEVGPAGGRQLDFWGGSDDHRGISRALARVQGLLGPDAVVTPVLGGGRAPLDEVRLVSWGEPVTPERAGGGPEVQGVASGGPDQPTGLTASVGRHPARLQVVAGGVAYLLAREGGRWWAEATYD